MCWIIEFWRINTLKVVNPTLRYARFFIMKKAFPHIWGEIMPAESLEELKEDYEYRRKAFESPVWKVVDNKLVELME